jgi:2-polyprenyl-3-methyl-5-hydroxy-6-metoxy-1,4-benzoquinol methylase
MDPICPLCKHKGSSFYKDQKHHFFLCNHCEGIFRDHHQFLNEAEEKKRYLHHKSDISDQGYYQFIKPIIESVKKNFESGNQGLDFGCGHTPILSKHLEKESFIMSAYDALFFNDASLLKKNYDFIVCCEVMEHFYKPLQMFQLLYDILIPGGALICKTHPYTNSIDFKNWYYKNDPSRGLILPVASFETSLSRSLI